MRDAEIVFSNQRRERERIASLKGRRGAAGQREVEEMESEPSPRLGILSALPNIFAGLGAGINAPRTGAPCECSAVVSLTGGAVLRRY